MNENQEIKVKSIDFATKVAPYDKVVEVAKQIYDFIKNHDENLVTELPGKRG